MGQTLSEPVTAKETASVADSQMKVGSSSMQGWRINMEDSHTHILSLPDDKPASFFAVYDGHGGAKVSHYAGKNLHRVVVQSELYKQGRYEEALREAFLNIDVEMLNDEDLKDELSGTTAICVLLRNNKIYCANVGDSRAICSVGGLSEALSHDHKPANETEARRIVAAGGWVEFNRVNGNLALSRALGDFIFKKNEERPMEEQIVCAVPDIIIRDITPDTEFILLACDGIWDVMSNQEVCDFVRDRLASCMEPESVCEELLTRCLAPDCQMGGLGCDNMTVVLVCLLQGNTWQAYCAKCARPRPPSALLMETEDVDGDSFVTPPHTPHQRPSGVSDGQSANNDAKSSDDEPVPDDPNPSFAQESSQSGPERHQRGAAADDGTESDDDQPPAEFCVVDNGQSAGGDKSADSNTAEKCDDNSNKQAVTAGESTSP